MIHIKFSWSLLCVFFCTMLLSLSSVSFAQGNYPLIYEENFEAGSINWEANIPENWRDSSDAQGYYYELLQPGPFGNPRRPTSSSVLTTLDVGNFEMEVVAKSNRDSTVLARDICLFFGFQDSLKFYYAHFAARSADVHNIIGMVNDTDRVKINLEPAGTTPPRLTDYQFHTLKIVRSVDSGSVEAFFDDELIMTALDTTFSWGKIGIGSFDDIATFKSVKLWGEVVSTGVGQSLDLPANFSLKQNYPNPFNPETTIEYQIPVKSHVRISVFNLLGQEIAKIVDAEKTAGVFKAKWNGKNKYGEDVASGIYLYRIRAGNFIQSRKLVLMR